MTRRSCRFHFSWLLAIHYVICVASFVIAQESEPQKQVWDKTLELLQRREYSLAGNLLENTLEDPDHFSFTSQLQEDLDAVNLLKKFSDTVDYSVEKLPESTPLKVLSRSYSFNRHLAGRSGKILFLTDPRGAEVNFPLSRLDSAAWLQIAEPELSNWPDRDFVTGIFLAFDRYQDIRLARTKLNAAAENGKNVTVWIKRLEDAEQQRKLNVRPSSNGLPANDGIIGKWTVALKNGQKLVWEFRKGGSGVVTEIGGKGRRLPANWVQDTNGVIRFTGSNGQTAMVSLLGDILVGKLADGRGVRGIRQAD